MSNITKTSEGGTPVIPPEVPLQFTTDNGIAIPATNNLNVIGQNAGTVDVVSTTGLGDNLTVENRAWITQYVVDPSATVGLRGTFQTIQGAITAAAATGVPATVFIRPGTYTENLTLAPNVNLQGFNTSNSQFADTVIVGNHTFTPPGATVDISIQSLTFRASSGSVFTFSNFTRPWFQNCIVNNSNGIAITGDTGVIVIDDSEITGVSFSLSNTGTVAYIVRDSSVLGTVNLTSALNCSYSTFGNVTASSLPTADSCVFGTLTLSGSSIIRNSYCLGITISGGILQVYNTVMGGNISGAASVQFGGLSFTNTNPVISSTGVQTQRTTSNDAIFVKVPGAYPYTAIAQDSIVLVDASAARTILLNSSIVGSTHIIKDNTGQAATNPINIQAFSGNIDGALSSTINVNWGSKRFVRTSTQWVTI